MLDTSYVSVVENIKDQIRSTHHKIILNANKELIILYWNIGKVINENSTWGSKFLNKLSSEIQVNSHQPKGFQLEILKIWLDFIESIQKLKLCSQ